MSANLIHILKHNLLRLSSVFSNKTLWSNTRGRFFLPSLKTWVSKTVKLDEHAVASIDDEIHPQAKCVWLEFEGLDVIYAYERHWKTGDWGLAERKKGNIPLVNNNPFEPDSESVFSANKH